MLKFILTALVLSLATVGGFNIYGSKSFQNAKEKVSTNQTIKSVTNSVVEVVKDITHTDSTK